MQLDPSAVSPIPGRGPRRDLRILLEDPALDITWARFAGGTRGAEAHVHHEHVDAFYVLDGEVAFTVGPDRDKVHAGAGTAILVPPGVVHGFDVDGDATTTFLNFHAPSTGFAAFLRGDRDSFDSTDPPANGGRPAADAVVVRGLTRASLGGLTLEVANEPSGLHAAVGDGRVLNVAIV